MRLSMINGRANLLKIVYQVYSNYDQYFADRVSIYGYDQQECNSKIVKIVEDLNFSKKIVIDNIIYV